MQIKDLTGLADREVRRYRENAAFLRGYADGGKAGKSERLEHAQRWVWAIERVCAVLKEKAPEKEAAFRRMYDLDRVHRRFEMRDTVVKLSLELHVSPSTLYRWREEILLSIAVAAVQSGAFKPY